jgi:hypothetical protein
MAIDVEWQDERGETLARYGGPPIGPRVWQLFPGSGACLRFIDPAGDSVFNQAQIEVLAGELDALIAGASQRMAVPELVALREFVEAARRQVHTYLKFIGD